MKKAGIFSFIFLQLMVALYSFGGIFGKLAARHSFMSIKFCLYYALLILFLFIYAIGWQQAIKKFELTAAYSAKSATVIWGMLWGILIFHESLTILKALGILLVFTGLIVYFSKGGEEKK
ncbi:MAG: transporter [Ruminococcus sp.]|nr:transporter [Ruminococcus sp.]